MGYQISFLGGKCQTRGKKSRDVILKHHAAISFMLGRLNGSRSQDFADRHVHARKLIHHSLSALLHHSLTRQTMLAVGLRRKFPLFLQGLGLSLHLLVSSRLVS